MRKIKKNQKLDKLPTQPDPDLLENLIFTNYSRMIWNKKITVEQANAELDKLEGFPINTRFIGIARRIEGRGIVVHYLKWVNGGWENNTEERRTERAQEVRRNRNG
ncbi:hypothetical protein FDI69_gp172 [Rhodococcus phage Trina]|uniref:Uncharacterized protein n=1 Tax=Rhodococcus phage Trina TaxID=2027905 RepID=A0A2D1ADX5_9CAUD|nr:hypothetical protein FDI69_gp172 [Rhodococcus phage Trina]ASZ75014.1 hypothetical protein SEA_TRINA_235 [Rhodococcus phage Trina]